jgi:hypothetical protein
MKKLLRLTALLSLCVCSQGMDTLDLRDASIVLPPGAPTPQKKAAQTLHEEIESRTQLRLPVVERWDGRSSAIVIGTPAELRKIAPKAASGMKASGKAEGFHLTTSRDGEPLVLIAGDDDRGVLFGSGYLLRHLDMSRQHLSLESGLDVVTAPKFPVRGHQLGYRPKTNSYDAWSAPMWEQYIRELAIFGTNTIELIPPRSDDAPDSPLFPLRQIDMMVEMSRICQEYGLNVSVWYPAMEKDYSDPQTLEKALHDWGEVFQKLPRIDEVFVPGGDPGHTKPGVMFTLLEKQTANLHKYHPRATMWMSPQGFDKAWMEEFYELTGRQPAWLSGIVFGPQFRDSLAEIRARVPKRYAIRFYPDITHSLHAQFPVPGWDAAFASTEGRETINPRPRGEAVIFHAFAPIFNGFVTYSEGCNDDVNKIVWSSLGWNPNQKVEDILHEYASFFIGSGMASAFSQGLLSLEQDWSGPLLSNSSVDTTIAQFQEMARIATPWQKLRWRFQQAQYRAHYDAFLRSRLISETAQENAAMGELRKAGSTGALAAIQAAEEQLKPRISEDAAQYRARVFELAEALFQSVRMQLSVPRYNAIGLRRGANLDAIDFALNNRVWLENRFAEIKAAGSESARLEKISAILNWTNPGPGGFYDDLGNPAQQPHLVLGHGFDRDPEFRNSALMGFGGKTPQEGWRVSWFTDAESLFDAPLRMHYTGLDRGARYKLRVVYGGDSPRMPVRLVANGNIQIHDYRPKGTVPEPVEFDIPAEATRDGELALEWTRTQGAGGSGRGCQVSEVWLIRMEEK